jgi:hypothetical protein
VRYKEKGGDFLIASFFFSFKQTFDQMGQIHRGKEGFESLNKRLFC